MRAGAVGVRTYRGIVNASLALSVSGCLLGVDPPPEADSQTKAKYPDVVSATVGAVPWSVKVNDTWFTSIDDTTFTIGGRNSSNYLGFRFYRVNRAGTYQIRQSGAPYVTVELEQSGVLYSNRPTFTNNTNAPIGSVTVTELTPTRISGTFTVVLPRLLLGAPGTSERESMPVTNGTFSIAVYPEYSIPIAR
jgi:hypothetical protein